MNTRRSLLALLLAASVGFAGDRALIDTSRSPRAKMQMVNLGDTTWAGGLLGERFDVCRDTMIPHLWTIFQDDQESHAWSNFLIAAGEGRGRDGKFHGPPFNDGDFLKWLEAMAQLYAVTRDPALDRQMDRIIAVIAKAQRGWKLSDEDLLKRAEISAEDLAAVRSGKPIIPVLRRLAR